ncbi:FRG domain-containing protein [Arthrobacter sp. efr-133-TYG-120]|uniref:FRG domain-containing protein n=1 Tax=Arthrobacter sp. efr-133-TYG-120 TaxID=3040280 RepID=UPI0025501005|nr:FRG domain-containing protein [Arthrobacter sp. efr-133-TYG-120]
MSNDKSAGNSQPAVNIQNEDKEIPTWHSAWARSVETPEELWAEIGFLSFSLGIETKFVWRGLPSAQYEVKSALARKLATSGVEPTEENLRFNEVRAIQAAREWGLGHSQYGYASDLHMLALMQHHGIPTRLIDVTYNPLTALWFACSDESLIDGPAVLIGMAVSDVPVIETVPFLPKQTWGGMEDPLGFDYSYALEKSAANEMPFLVQPVVRDARMTAQEGLFITASVPEQSAATPMWGFPYKGNWLLLSLVREMKEMDVDIQGSRWPSFGMMGLIIPPEVKKVILPILENSFNRSHRTMYPDLSGFAGQNFNYERAAN